MLPLLRAAQQAPPSAPMDTPSPLLVLEGHRPQAPQATQDPEQPLCLCSTADPAAPDPTAPQVPIPMKRCCLRAPAAAPRPPRCQHSPRQPLGWTSSARWALL